MWLAFVEVAMTLNLVTEAGTGGLDEGAAEAGIGVEVVVGVEGCLLELAERR